MAEVMKMVSARRWWVALLTMALLLAGSAAAWLYFDHQAPRVPARARQVMAVDPGCCQAPLPLREDYRGGIKPPSLRQTIDRNTRSIDKGAE